MKISFSPPWIDDDVRAEVMAALDSGWITSGPRVRQLETQVAALTGSTSAVCCNSATSALMLVMHWYGVGKGDEVIIPAYTYAATALTVMHLGATPVMVDVRGDFNLDAEAVKRKITAKTKVIIPVDIAGWPCDYKSIMKMTETPEIKNLFVPANETQKKLGRILVLADSAHSFGARYSGKPLGTWADFTVFSFHAVKNLTTAEGGAITFSLPETFDAAGLQRTLKLWTLNGQTKDAFTKSQAGDWKYDIIYPGFKMNMPDICAAIGVAQMRKYESFILPERKKLDDAYRAGFAPHVWAELPPADTDDTRSSYHLFALRIKNITEDQRNSMISFISRLEVSVNVHFQPLPLLTIFRERGYKMNDYPVAYDNYAREISLPIYPGLTDDQIEFIINAVQEAYESVVHGEKVV